MEQTPFNNLPTHPSRSKEPWRQKRRPNCIHERLELVEGSPVGLKKLVHEGVEVGVKVIQHLGVGEVEENYPQAPLPPLVEDYGEDVGEVKHFQFFLRCVDCQREWVEFR